ncbi:MAG: hypothetical protein IKP77_05680 [Acholeplasmatales bacterium]|nr:hypothetical protein [Acholeplasmatales bacterium]MBR6288577.1 hypothetical protein [Acholeplasmatales bacterium]
MARNKKLTIIGLLIVGLGISLSLLFLNLQSFKETTIRFQDIFDITNLKTCFDNYLIENTKTYADFEASCTETVTKIGDYFANFNQDSFMQILQGFFNFLYIALMYVLNVGINLIVILFIFIRESIYGTQLKIKTSKLALVLIKIREFFTFILNKIKQFLKYLLHQLKKHKRIVLLFVLDILISNGFLYRFLVELIIFLESYIYHMFNFDINVVFESFLKAAITWALPIIRKVPKPLWYVLIYVILFMIGLGRAKYKLRKNHKRLKEIAHDELTQTTFINGAPGTGKTLLNVSLSLASEEAYIDELEKKLLDYEAKYRFLNFAEIRSNPELYPEHAEYINTLKMLNDRGTFLISNYAIYSPYFSEYSKIFNFDYMRKNIEAKEYPLEEYIVMSLSEIDKEYNSHDNMKEVGTDGAHTFFSTVSHDLKRHCKIFCDYQLKDQVPLRIRGNAEWFINIKKRKLKMPLILKMYYLPFKGLKTLCEKLLISYELKKKTINKETTRKTIGTYKRNDYNTTYYFLRNMNTTLTKICAWFEKYQYFKLSALKSQEGDEKGERITFNINLCDLHINNQKLYDSTFLSYAYEQKKNMPFKDIESFTRLTPTIEELNKCNSKFYNKINN